MSNNIWTMKNLEILAEKSLHDKSILRYITFKSDYPLANTEQSMSMALTAFVKKLEGYTRKRNDLKLMRLTLQMLALTGTNDSLKEILKIMIHKKVLMDKNWKYFVTLTFKEEYRKESFYQKIKAYCEKLTLKNITYYCVFESTDTNLNPHYHLLITDELKDGMIIKKLWQYGIVRVDEVQDKYKDFVYLLKELTDAKVEANKQIYSLHEVYYINIRKEEEKKKSLKNLK